MGRCPQKGCPDDREGEGATATWVVHPAVKTEVVELVRTSGKSIAAVAREMDLTETAVREWVRLAEVDAGKRATTVAKNAPPASATVTSRASS
jgi:transposase-like protein